MTAQVINSNIFFRDFSLKNQKYVLTIILFLKSHIYKWVLDHRVHHKYTDTDADPHNATRGFMFAHFYWVLYKKHPLVVEKGKGIDMSDIESDKILMFQKRY